MPFEELENGFGAIPLAEASDSSTVPLAIEGLVIGSQAGRILVVVGQLCLELRADDIVAAELLDIPGGTVESLATPMRLTVSPGARLMGISSAAIYRELLTAGRRPFAISARAEVPQSFGSPRFKSLEQGFFAQRGYHG